MGILSDNMADATNEQIEKMKQKTKKQEDEAKEKEQEMQARGAKTDPEYPEV